MKWRKKMKMKKRSFGVILGIFFTAAIFFISSTPGIAEPIKWRVVTTWTPAITLIKTDQYFIKLANEMCKGELEMKLFPAGEIVSSFEAFSAVQSGTVQAGCDWAGYWAGKNSAFGAIGALPCGLEQPAYVTWIYKGGGAELADEVYGNFGMKYLFTGLLPAESGVRGKKAFKRIADFKGAKIRMSGMFQGEILKALGASQVMIAGQEIYQALEKGVIDAAEFSTPDNDWSLGFQEVTKVWNTPGWHQPASPLGIMINKKAWDSLPKNVQLKLQAAAMATFAYTLALYDWDSAVYTKKFIDKGTKVSQLEPAALAEIQKMSYAIYEKEAAKNPLFAKLAYSQFQTMEMLQIWRDKQKGFHYMPEKVPNMQVLKTEAAKAK
jgi:TRAP-type mannitol/chloroaromatic compound transport system substrate-binding protein